MRPNLNTQFARLTLIFIIALACAPLAIPPAQANIVPFYTRTNTIAVDPARSDAITFHDGLLYVADEVSDQILIYDSNFNIIQTLSGFNNPRGVAVNGDLVYVGSYSGSNLSVLENGVLLNSTPVTQPYDVAIDSRGHILVASINQDSVFVYTPDFILVETLSVPGAKNLAVGPDGRIHVASLMDDNVSVFTPYFSLIQTYGSFNPGAIDVNINGYSFVSNLDDDIIEIFAPDFQRF